MKNNKVRNLAEFRRWVKIRMIEEDITQRELAEQMGTYHARISEAINGKPSGRPFVVPLIEALDGNKRDFEEFLKAI